MLSKEMSSFTWVRCRRDDKEGVFWLSHFRFLITALYIIKLINLYYYPLYYYKLY
jgi:hypothetical protein